MEAPLHGPVQVGALADGRADPSGLHDGARRSGGADGRGQRYVALGVAIAADRLLGTVAAFVDHALVAPASSVGSLVTRAVTKREATRE